MKKMLLLTLLVALNARLFAQKDDFAPVFSTAEGAIHGYDPVAYFTEGKPVKGASDISLAWSGGTWHFSNVANRDSFQLRPEKYAPAYGGYCAYGWARGYPAKTEPEAWTIVDGTLYLNYNKAIKADWDKKQAAYIKKANANWQKARQK